MPPNNPQTSEFFFRGSGSVTKPNHMTRYIYPSFLDHPPSCLRLQPPANSTSRTRPQGSGSWGEDGHTFLTITYSGRAPPTRAQFEAWITDAKAQDHKTENPLGRAMRRVTGYQGNTVLESGKFKLKREGGLCFAVKRKTTVLLREGGFGIDEDLYVIPVERWYDMMPPTEEGRGHDSWWMRLHDLYQGKFDRAFFHAKEQMDLKLEVAAPVVKWRRRPDIEDAVKIFHKGPLPKDGPSDAGDMCITCSKDWFTESDAACRLKCGHFFCLECTTSIFDLKTGRGNIFEREKDPKSKFLRCPQCRAINPVRIDRCDVISSDEFNFWRFKISMRFLEKDAKDNWLTHLHCLPLDGWSREPPKKPKNVDMDHNEQEEWFKTYVRYEHVVEFMEAVPKFVWGLLPYGFTADNPVHLKEGVVLEQCLKDELKRLSRTRQMFNTAQIMAHMDNVGERAIKPVIVSEKKEDRLGNPKFPPGYLDYRKFLCEWTARGVLLSPMGRMEIMGFTKKMREEKKAWWKDVREVWFDP